MASELVLREIKSAAEAFRMLNGCVCLYKPSKKGFNKTRLAFTQKITDELNSMECRSPRERIEIIGDLSFDNYKDSENDLEVIIKPNLADHPLVSGPRYNPRHLAVNFTNNPGWYASGVMVGFIGSHTYKANQFIRYNLPKIFEIKGEFGLASLNYRDDGKVRMKTGYKHIQKVFFQRILSKIEAAQRSLLFKASCVDMNSEQAYQIALGNLTEPLKKFTKPIVTAIQPISFNLPDFTFQVECYNDNEVFLAELVNEIGIALKSSARCTGIRLIKYGPFTVDHSLIQKHWTLENVIENLYYSNKVLESFENQHPLKQEQKMNSSKI